MDIQKLSQSERILLAEKLWDSVVEEDVLIEISDEQKTELDNRISSFDEDGKPGKSWDEIKLKYNK